MEVCHVVFFWTDSIFKFCVEEHCELVLMKEIVANVGFNKF